MPVHRYDLINPRTQHAEPAAYLACVNDNTIASSDESGADTNVWFLSGNHAAGLLAPH